MKIKQLILTSCLLALSMSTDCAWAQTTTTDGTNAKQPESTTSSDKTHKPKNIVFCPPISTLRKNPIKMNWTAPGGWKSYDISFIEKVSKFLGAQWNGVNIGQITCVYSAAKKHVFPIKLIFHTLALEPSDGKWTKNLGGYRDCFSIKQKNCAFKVRTKPKPKDIYKEAESLKSNNNSSQGSDF